MPEFTHEARSLLAELSRLDTSNLKALFGWMIRFAPVQYCGKWSLTVKQRKDTLAKLKRAFDVHRWKEHNPMNDIRRAPSLKRSQDDLVWATGMCLDEYGRYANASWVKDARKWLAGKY